MPKTVEYGVAVAVLQINGKMKTDWEHRDSEVNLEGTNSRLIVRDLDHAKALAASCEKIWSEYEQENLLRGPKRGRRPGSGFKKLAEDLAKVIEEKREPKEYTSTMVAHELDMRIQEGKDARQEEEAEKKRRRRKPKGALDAFFPGQMMQTFGDINLREPIPVDYGEWTGGECALTVRNGSEIELFGQGESRDDALAELVCAMEIQRDNLKDRLADEEIELTEREARWAYLYGLIEEEPAKNEEPAEESTVNN